jgi:hypothetical protein
MATDKYPNQNVNVPIGDRALAAARAKLAPGGYAPVPPTPQVNGKGSKREVRKGEWIDDRVIQIGGPASPSEDSPPELPKKRDAKALPTFVADKAYSVSLAESVVVDGRALSPGKEYIMAGYVCIALAPTAITDAVELGDIPADPDVAPSAAKSEKKKA